MGSNIYGSFSDQNPDVLSGQVITANNNQATLNVALAEADQVRGSSIALQPTGLLASLANDVPSASGAVQGTIGAALGGIGQEGTPSTEPGGGGIACFLGLTHIDTPHGDVAIDHIQLGETVWGFDPETGERVPQRVIARWEHLVPEYTLVEFADGRTTGLIEEHRYWIRPGYAPIRDLDFVWHWSHNAWVKCAIEARHIMTGEVIVYNLSVEGHRNYLANGDSVSNLKPLRENES